MRFDVDPSWCFEHLWRHRISKHRATVANRKIRTKTSDNSHLFGQFGGIGNAKCICMSFWWDKCCATRAQSSATPLNFENLGVPRLFGSIYISIGIINLFDLNRFGRWICGKKALFFSSILLCYQTLRWSRFQGLECCLGFVRDWLKLRGEKNVRK